MEIVWEGTRVEAISRLMPITEARAKLAELVDELDTEKIVVLVRRSRPAAILMSPHHYTKILETIDDLDTQCAVLYAQLHPEEGVSSEKMRAELGLMDEEPTAATG